MKLDSYFGEISYLEDEIETTFRKSVQIIFGDKYFSRFNNLPIFCVNFPATFLCLWKKYELNECSIIIHAYKEELINVICQEKFDQEMKQNHAEYQRSFHIILSFLDEAEKEYYSGFWGFFRKLSKLKKIEKKMNNSETRFYIENTT